MACGPRLNIGFLHYIGGRNVWDYGNRMTLILGHETYLRNDAGLLPVFLLILDNSLTQVMVKSGFCPIDIHV